VSAAFGGGFSKNSLEDFIKLSSRVHGEFSTNDNSGTAGGLFGTRETSGKYHNVRLSSVQFGADFRITGDSHLIAQFVLDGEGVVLDSVYFLNDVAGGLVLMAGQLAIPLSMEADTSGNHLVMNEKTRTNLGNSGNKDIRKKSVVLFTTSGIGLNCKYMGKYAGLQVGVYGNDFKDDNTRISKTIFSARGHINPYRNGNNVIHIGGGYFYEDRRLSGLPSLGTTDEASKIGSLPIFGSDRIGIEFALNYGIINIQMEYGFPTAKFGKFHDDCFEGETKKTKRLSSFYAQVNLNLTCETMKYDDGVFKQADVRNPVNKNGWGAFALAFRYANSNLNDYSIEKPFDYGKHEEFAAALNWRPNNSLRLTAQYSWFNEKFDLPEAMRLNGGNTNKYGAFSLKSRFFF
jgi:phosphate-selective porin